MAGGSHRLGAALGMMPDVRDEILVFALDIIDNLAAPADPAEGARKLSGNYLGASAR